MSQGASPSMDEAKPEVQVYPQTNLGTHISYEAITLVYTVIKDAIEVGAFGLGELIEIWTIKCDVKKTITPSSNSTLRI